MAILHRIIIRFLRKISQTQQTVTGICDQDRRTKDRQAHLKDLINRKTLFDRTDNAIFPFIVKLQHSLDLIKDPEFILRIQKDQIFSVRADHASFSALDKIIRVTNIEQVFLQLYPFSKIADSFDPHFTSRDSRFRLKCLQPVIDDPHTELHVIIIIVLCFLHNTYVQIIFRISHSAHRPGPLFFL